MSARPRRSVRAVYSSGSPQPFAGRMGPDGGGADAPRRDVLIGFMTKRIVCTPDTLAGKPRIAGTRISVAQVLKELAAGETPADIVESYPSLEIDDVKAAIAFAIEQVDAARVAAE